jgi:sugar-specific transcriptional regulator TrmB
VTVKGNVPDMTDFLDEKRKEIQARLKELKPLVDEYSRLEAAERALSGVGATPRAAASTAPRRGRRSSSGGSSSSNGRRGRPKGSGTRSLQALELVRAKPGITIPELAEAMGIKQNYLYRVMPQLASDGQVVKSGRGWHARDKS